MLCICWTIVLNCHSRTVHLDIIDFLHPVMHKFYKEGVKIYISGAWRNVFFFIADQIIYTATPPDLPQQCILIDYFNWLF